MTPTPETTPGPTPREAPPSRTRIAGRMSAIAATALVVVAAGAIGLYGMRHSAGKHVAHSGACAGSLDLANAVEPLVRGEVAALTLANTPHQLDRIAFDDAAGTRTSVAAFGGKTILLNLWATWCVPCRAEMPALDKLQAQLGSDRFGVVPVDVDTARLEKARGFFKEIGATSLPYYADNSADVLQSLKQNEPIVGLPTTILVGADGCEIGTMAGPAQWDSPDAKTLIERLARPPKPGSQT